MGFFHLLLILFLTIPLIEIFLLLEIGSIIGTMPTILLIIVTAIVGAALVRQQGISTFTRVQMQFQRAEVPALELMEGVVVLVAGALLLTPGFFTDTIGFLCLIPPLRRYVLVRLIKRFIQTRFINQQQNRPPRPRKHGDNTLEGEYWRDD